MRSWTTFFLALVLLGAGSAASTTANAESYAERFAEQRRMIVERLESYGKSTNQSRRALLSAEKAIALSRQFADDQALSIAMRAKANALSAIAKLEKLKSVERARLAALDKRRSYLIDHKRVDYVSRFEGSVSRTGGKKLDAPLEAGDTITTGHNGYFEVAFLGGSTMALGPNTTLRLLDDDEATYYQIRGKIYHALRCRQNRINCRQLQISGAVLGVRGTNFETIVTESGLSTARVYEGIVVATPDKDGAEPIAVNAGYELTVDKAGNVLGHHRFDPKVVTQWWQP